MPRAKIGSAWIDVLLSFDGVGESIEKQLTKETSSSGKKAGKKLGSAMGEEAGKETSTAIAEEVEDGATGAGKKSGATLGKGMVAGLAALGIGKLIGDAIQTGLEQQKSSNLTAAALNLNPEEQKKVAEASSDLFTQAYGESYEAVQESMRAIVGSVEGAREASSEELVSMGKDVLNLSEAYGLGSAEILKSVQSQLSSGFASSWDEAISNVLGGFQTMGANGEDYFETLNEYSDDFKTLGLNGEEAINLVSAALAAGVRNTDVFADALQEFQIRLGDMSSFDALTALGFDPKNIQDRIGEGGDTAQAALSEVWTKLQASGDRDLFGQIFGTQAEDYFDAFNTIDLSGLNAGLAEGIGNMEKFDAVLNEGGSASLEAFQRLVQQTFVEIMLPALEVVTPILSSFAGFLAENEWAAAALAFVIGGVLLVAIVGITGALWAMIAPILANPLTWIILAAVAAVALLIGIFWLLWENWDTIVASISAGLERFVNWLGEAFANLSDFFTGLAKGIANYFIGIANMIVNVINRVIRGINMLKIDLPDWMGGGTIGFNIATIPNIPSLAKGATINPTPDGTLVRVAEAGRAESVVDTGVVNEALRSGLQGTENNSNSGPTYIINQLPGESTEELVTRIQEFYDFNGLAAGTGYSYAN